MNRQDLSNMIAEATHETVRLLQRGEPARKIRANRIWIAELWRAENIVRKYQARVAAKQMLGTTALDRYEQLRDDICAQMDVEMMSRP